MGDDETRALYEVPAQDAAGRPVTLRLRPNSAVVTIEIIQDDGSPLSKFTISITQTGRFASLFGACAHSATKRGIGELS